MSHADDLKKILQGDVDTSQQTRDRDSRDASIFRVEPELVVFPKNTNDVSAVVNYVRERKKEGEDISLTARSAGTDMSGGALNNSIIVEFTKYFNHVLQVEDSFAVTEPGVYYRDFDKETKKKNLILPSYTASREINTVGGMVANNSGGEKNLKYGKTARYVEEVEMVLHDGSVGTFKKLSKKELANACAVAGAYGEVHRNISKLISENRTVIEKARPIVTKNSAGYALWDVVTDDGSFDIPKLITGSQGTLGLITKIKFGLVRPKPHSAMAVFFLKDLKDLGRIAAAITAHGPESFESYDDHTFTLGAKYFPEFAAQMKTNLFSLGIDFIPELWLLLTGGVPKLVLLAEFTGETPAEARAQAEACARDIKTKFTLDARIAKNERESRKYWVVRRESFNLLRKKVRGKRTAPFMDDFVVPPAVLPEFFPKLDALLAAHPDITYTIAGHVGDGNFHIIPLIDFSRPDLATLIDTLSHQVYDLVLSYHGSITGEHNDGLIRTPYIEKMFGADMYKLFIEVKKIFDPENIFNPGKKVGTTFAQAMEKLDIV